MINLYDFDYTIYDGDSMVDFYTFSLKRNPSLIRYLPIQAWHILLFALRIENKNEMKTGFLSFIKGIRDMDEEVDIFWQRHSVRLKSWYMEKGPPRHDDVIVSASPDAILSPLKSMLGVREIIATPIDKRTGMLIGENCYGKEKVIRVLATFPDEKVNEAYTDHLSDLPLIKLADSPYLVKGNKVKKFPLRERK